MNKGKKKLIEAKALCNDAKIGNEIVCPSCGTTHVKKSYQSVFCKSKGGTKCKDNFWNNVDPKKRNNRTRISPASARFTADREIERERNFDPNDEHPFSSEGLGQWCD